MKSRHWTINNKLRHEKLRFVTFDSKLSVEELEDDFYCLHDPPLPVLELSMNELGQALGGSGKARTFWKYLCDGRDPLTGDSLLAGSAAFEVTTTVLGKYGKGKDDRSERGKDDEEETGHGKIDPNTIFSLKAQRTLGRLLGGEEDRCLPLQVHSPSCVTLSHFISICCPSILLYLFLLYSCQKLTSFSSWPLPLLLH